jgi:hypothetical protein
MPDWHFFKDGEGNTYYIDNAGKIVTSGAPRSSYRVSVRGLEYYTAHAEELIISHHPVNGLLILKTILAMPGTDQRIVDAQNKASANLNALKQRHGTRFDEMNRLASPLIFENNGETTIIHDVLFYSFKTPHRFDIIRNKWRLAHNYWYNGLLIGVRMNGSKRTSGYDFLFALDSEKFAKKLESLNRLADNWNSKLFLENIEHTQISIDETKAVYSFSAGTPPSFAGFESFVKNGNFGYILRSIAPTGASEDVQKAMKEIVGSFSVSDLN